MPAFAQLWTSHPANWNPPETHPCRDKNGNVHSALDNQCAIRLGIALQGAGVVTDTVSGARCWNNHGLKHILRVKDFLPWIERNTTAIGCKKKTIHKGVTWRDFSGKQGIAYFQNFWGTNNQGDHIDLWNGQKVAKGNLDYFERSEEVWFWEM
jgi:hypothetical protein